MRLVAATLAVLLAALAAGCVEPTDPLLLPCDLQEPEPVSLYLAPGRVLQPTMPEAGAVAGNGFAQAFLTDDMDVWFSGALTSDRWILDDVHIELWVRAHQGVAPLVIGGETGTAYHFFNQFGTNRTFAPAYATEYANITWDEGEVFHYNETLQMPPGGFVLPAGESVRVLLTTLAMDGPRPTFDILVGGDTPSRVWFDTHCVELPTGAPTEVAREQVTLPGNQGLLTGAIPPTEGINQATVWFELPDHATRLDFAIEQDLDANPVKDDLDLALVDEEGNVLWSAGSPYSVESGTVWAPNLQALFPAGTYGLRIDSYSGIGVAVDAQVIAYA